MDRGPYKYSGRPTRNPLRFLLALWRVTRDPGLTEEAGIVEIAFARSRFFRRFARWGTVVDALARDPRTAPALQERSRFGPIDLARLAELPEGTLGYIFASHCRARGLDPNLVRIEGDGLEDWLLDHLYGTHDVWHVVTGWGNDESGEVGLGSFYMAQLGAPFFAFALAFLLLNTVFVKPHTLRERMEALVSGWEMAKRAEPLFGVRWDELWGMPIEDVRSRFRLTQDRIVGEGVRAAA